MLNRMDLLLWGNGSNKVQQCARQYAGSIESVQRLRKHMERVCLNSSNKSQMRYNNPEGMYRNYPFPQKNMPDYIYLFQLFVTR